MRCEYYSYIVDNLGNFTDLQRFVSEDNLSSPSVNVSVVSSELNEEQLQAARILEDELLTPSDLGFQSHEDFPIGWYLKFFNTILNGY